MALETLLLRVKTAISHSFDAVRHTSSTPHHNTAKPSRKSTNVGVLAFEIAGLMSKLLHLWQSLSDKNMIRLHNESINLEGVRKIVSNDDAFLLSLACSELVENLRFLAKSVARISHKCNDANLRSFDRLFNDFANSGRDPYNWVINSKDMESKNNKKLDRYVNLTAQLYREMDELSALESSLRKAFRSEEYDASLSKEQKVLDLQQKIVWQRQEIKYLKDRSLWNRSFETVTWILARSIFTILARTKLVFGIGQPSSLPRSLSASATVHPSDQGTACRFVSGPLVRGAKPLEDFDEESTIVKDDYSSGNGFFESNSKLLKPPPSTLGAAALALHYANLIIVMEKMIKFPQMVGVDARDDLYTMLPSSVRSALRARLRGVGFSASDPVLAGEWREALGRILGWLSPLAHNMIKWQSERSFEQQNMVPKTNVMLLQTLFFANKDKTEAAITELLVGLNYICRFEREMTAKALFECNNSINGLLNLQSSS
ncbi:protein PSK SIMULATOR 3 [Rosa rugosa]|uniref:protein PSK SIMULATOR 3 n=1 Tax=Rosa rugosa TaxID=74645 RepID=UPI002B400533|nr:protein PSK SIMULATOR 3 [Rosa rugosa]